MSLLRARVPKPTGYKGVGGGTIGTPLGTPVYVGGVEVNLAGSNDLHPSVEGARVMETDGGDLAISIDISRAAGDLSQGEGPCYLSLLTRRGWVEGVQISREATPGSGLGTVDVKRQR
jgi:hypothetical protein